MENAMTGDDPDLYFISYRNHPYIRNFLRTYPKLRGIVGNRFAAVMAVFRKRTTPITIHFVDGRDMVASDWRELDYMLKAACITRAFQGTWDPLVFDSLMNERAQIARLDALHPQDLKGERKSGVFNCAPTASVKDMILYLLVMKHRPKRVIETGVSHGVSSRFILSAMNRTGEGKLISIDLPAYDPEGRKYYDGTIDHEYVPEKLGVGWLVTPELRSRWDLRLGKSSEVLPTITGDVDLFMHDSEHSYDNMLFEYNWAHDHLAPGGFLASDDVNKAFDDFLAAHKGQYQVLVNGLIGAARRSK
jgi:hypothetical protein